MLLYHGSNMMIEEIDLAKSRPYKDFGKAFYLSDNEKQAKEMARFKVMTGGGVESITVFDFGENDISMMKVKRFFLYDFFKSFLYKGVKYVYFRIKNDYGRNCSY